MPAYPLRANFAIMNFLGVLSQSYSAVTRAVNTFNGKKRFKPNRFLTKAKVVHLNPSITRKAHKDKICGIFISQCWKYKLKGISTKLSK